MKKILVLIISVLLVSILVNARKEKFDHSKFDALLKNNVDANGFINYDGFKNNKQFEEYLASIENADISNFSKEEKLAFYINAYNATVIKNVLDHWPINSPMDVDGFFDKTKFTFAGKEETLNGLEYNHVFKIDPVLCHFGLVCSGKSCPKLLQKAYDGDNVYKQLEDNAKVFMSDPNKNKLDRDNRTLYLSEIFKWFKDKFVERYGSLKETAIHFMSASDANFLKGNNITIKYMKYNWQLNKQ